MLPSCSQDKPAIPLKNFSLTPADEIMLAALSNAILPATNDFYGAAEVNAHAFTVMMVDECESPEVQKIYTGGLQSFTKKVDDEYNNKFDKLTAEKQNEILSKLETKSFGEKDLQQFYSMTKSYTLLAFTSSSKYMTEIRKYKMVPGSNFKGCVEVS